MSILVTHEGAMPSCYMQNNIVSYFIGQMLLRKLSANMLPKLVRNRGLNRFPEKALNHHRVSDEMLF